jgi:hypothetical protein
MTATLTVCEICGKPGNLTDGDPDELGRMDASINDQEIAHRKCWARDPEAHAWTPLFRHEARDGWDHGEVTRLRDTVEAVARCWRAEFERAGRLERALGSVRRHSLLRIRRAAFAPEIGVRYTETIRAGIAAECARLEQFIDKELIG